MNNHKLESSQVYDDNGPNLNPSDHPAERVSNERGDCFWMDGKYCNNRDVFDDVTVVSGGYCTTCDEWRDENDEPID